MEKADEAAVRILRLPEVRQRVGLARSTIYDRLNPDSPRFDSTFPRPVKLGSTAVGWYESQIEEWIKSLHKSDFGG